MAESSIYVQIGARLREFRIKSGYKTSASFAEKLGINQPTYSNHENGNRGISIEVIMEYAQHLNVSWQYLVTGEANCNVHEDSLENKNGKNYILYEDLFEKSVIAVDEVFSEKDIKASAAKKADLAHYIYTMTYKRFLENSRLSLKDIKMCVETIVEFGMEFKKG